MERASRRGYHLRQDKVVEGANGKQVHVDEESLEQVKEDII